MLIKPYSSYQVTDIPWLKSYPSHWKINRGKSLLQRIDSRSNTGAEELLTVSSSKGVIPRKFASVTMFKAKSYLGYKLCWPGDLVINSLWAWAGGLGVSRHHGIISSAYGVYRVREKGDLHPEYLNHLVRSSAFNWELHVRSKGIWISRLQLTDEAFLDASLIVPPFKEQLLILQFLEWANGKFDRAIRAKKKVIALLNEQKQAIILRAVTKGIHPDVKLKDSGYPWLGKIPEHWETRRLRTLVEKIEQGVSPQAIGFLATGDSWGVLKSGCVNHGIFREEEHKQLSSSFEIHPSIAVAIGDVLISRACGSPSLVGSVGRVQSLKYKLILSDKTFRAVFKPIVDIDFMVFAMNCPYYRRQVEQAISGAEGMANNLPLSSLKDFVFAIPPKSESQAISDYVRKKLVGIFSGISRLEKEIDLFHEYRTRLNADVVTGKLDVREAAARLPAIDLVSSPIEAELDAEDEEEIATEDIAA